MKSLCSRPGAHGVTESVGGPSANRWAAHSRVPEPSVGLLSRHRRAPTKSWRAFSESWSDERRARRLMNRSWVRVGAVLNLAAVSASLSHSIRASTSSALVRCSTIRVGSFHSGDWATVVRSGPRVVGTMPRVRGKKRVKALLPWWEEDSKVDRPMVLSRGGLGGLLGAVDSTLGPVHWRWPDPWAGGPVASDKPMDAAGGLLSQAFFRAPVPAASRT
mmetsp:Transcript_16992/g.35933  ORF Transcript_16992/g.35933 Transcript_16992/m.35933 type:complete len:218 (-) Transcript_16992:162-815(-)